jgi:hypothetical protein
MSDYNAPVKDMTFLLKHVIGLDQVSKLPGCEEVTDDLVDSIFDEAAKFAKDILAPLNTVGDKNGQTMLLPPRPVLKKPIGNLPKLAGTNWRPQLNLAAKVCRI